MPSTTDMLIAKERLEDEAKIKFENDTDEISSLQKVVEIGMKTEEMCKTPGYIYWENEILFRIEESNSQIYDLDPVKKPTMITRHLERAATLRELISKIKKTIELKNIAITRLNELRKKS